MIFIILIFFGEALPSIASSSAIIPELLISIFELFFLQPLLSSFLLLILHRTILFMPMHHIDNSLLKCKYALFFLDKYLKLIADLLLTQVLLLFRVLIVEIQLLLNWWGFIIESHIMLALW